MTIPRRRTDHLAAILIAFGVVAYLLVVTSIAFVALLAPVALVRYLLS
jgi:hypothetical protein